MLDGGMTKDFWVHVSWHKVGPFKLKAQFLKDLHDLVAIAGGWKSLLDQSASGDVSPKVLAEFRKKLDIPSFNPAMPWQRERSLVDMGSPTQQWLMAALADFIEWHVKFHGQMLDESPATPPMTKQEQDAVAAISGDQSLFGDNRMVPLNAGKKAKAKA